VPVSAAKSVHAAKIASRTTNFLIGKPPRESFQS
jgi:hypothetical protein